MDALTQERLPEAPHFDYEKRRYNDTVTWLAEVLPGHMRTPFEYQYDGHELYADDGSSLAEVFDDAIKQAEHLPAYEQRRRRTEKAEYKDMLSMMRGELPNTMVVVSDFPRELMGATKDEGGYNASRKQAMLRVLVKTPENKLKMYSQSLDLSNRPALEKLYEYLGQKAEPGELLGQRVHRDMDEIEKEFLVDQLMGIYDRNLEAQFGGQWYAGRQDKPAVNTYEFVLQQRDLLNAYLATTDYFEGGEVDYNLAAAFESRYQHQRRGGALGYTVSDNCMGPALVAHLMALEEMRDSGDIARQTGVTFSGCGATLEALRTDGQGASSKEELEASGYGNKADKLPNDKFGTRYFKCPKGHQNTRWIKNELIERCQVCNCSVRCA